MCDLTLTDVHGVRSTSFHIRRIFKSWTPFLAKITCRTYTRDVGIARIRLLAGAITRCPSMLWPRVGARPISCDISSSTRRRTVLPLCPFTPAAVHCSKIRRLFSNTEFGWYFLSQWNDYFREPQWCCLRGVINCSLSPKISMSCKFCLFGSWETFETFEAARQQTEQFF